MINFSKNEIFLSLSSNADLLVLFYYLSLLTASANSLFNFSDYAKIDYSAYFLEEPICDFKDFYFYS